MASVKFYLKDSKSEKTNIYFFLNYGAYEVVEGKKKYLPLKYYINESINAKYWNTKTGRAKQDSRFKQFPEFNARLQDIEDKALSVLRKMLNDNETITKDALKLALDSVLKSHTDQTTSSKKHLLEFLDYYVETSGMRSNTMKSYKQTARNLREYEQEKNIKLTFERIDIDFHANFIQYLKGKNYSVNSIGDRIKVLKSILRASHERGLHDNTDYQKKAFTRPKEETTAVYLNDDELMRIYNLDLSDNKKLDNVRDWFIIASYTGLRFSDLSSLTNNNIKDDVIEIKTSKTGATVTIPLHSYVKQILEKHKFSLPKIVSNQKFNEYIKNVAEEAKINDLVLMEEIRGNLKTQKAEPKHKLITAHTARRSFATNAFLAGVPTIQIMKLTGHKTEKVFMTYIKITGKENARKLQLHPFFNKMIVK